MKPMYFTDIEALEQFIKNNYSDFLESDYDGYSFNVDRLFKEFYDELRTHNSGMYYLDYEQE